jgi:hypothetical protein
MNIEKVKLDLMVRTQRGIVMFYIGAVYWFILWILSFFHMPIKLLGLLYLIGAGMLFPLGVLLSRLLKIDFMAKDNPLSNIAGLIGGMQLFFAPILVLIFLEKIEWLPFFAAILTGAHFFPFTALYNSKGYVFQTISVVLLTTIIGFIWMEQIYHLLPFGLSVLYFITSMILSKENKQVSLHQLQERIEEHPY